MIFNKLDFIKQSLINDSTLLTLQNMHEFNLFVSQGTCFGCFNKAILALTKKIIITSYLKTYFGYWVAQIFQEFVFHLDS